MIIDSSKVDYIFAGNNPAHYFGRNNNSPKNVINNNIIYWADIKNNIVCYNVDGWKQSIRTIERNEATFIKLNVTKKQVYIEPLPLN